MDNFTHYIRKLPKVKGGYVYPYISRILASLTYRTVFNHPPVSSLTTFYKLKNKIILLPLVFAFTSIAYAQTGINTRTPDENSVLDIVSDSKGVLLPRLNNTQVDNLANITGLPEGMLVYNTTKACIQVYTGTAFECLVVGSQSDTTRDSWKDDAANKRVYLPYKADGTTARPDDSTVVIKDNGYMGIGLTNPAGILDIKGKMYINNKQTIYNPHAMGTYLNSLFIGNGGGDLTTGYDNTAVGIDALSSNTSGYSNNAFGYKTLANNTSGRFNIAVGLSALEVNEAGDGNVGIGTFALYNNTAGRYNTAIGLSAMNGNETGEYNVALGTAALSDNQSGEYNVAIGMDSGRGITTGSNNTILGSRVIDLPNDLSNNIILADGEGYQRIRVLSNGNTGIGTTTPKSRLDIGGYAKLASNDDNVDGGLTTASERAGMIRYNIDDRLQYHNQDQWVTLADASGVFAADPTKDAWVDDNTNTMVKLGTQSDGSTARTAGTEVVIKDNGKVGIGTASPTAKLEVNNGDFLLENQSNWNAYKGVTYSDANYPQLFLMRALGSKTSPSYPSKDRTLGVFKGTNAIDAAGGAGFRVRAMEDQTATAQGTGILIFTSPNGTKVTKDQVLIDHNGNMGLIGPIEFSTHNYPKSRLEISGYAKLGSSDATADALPTASDRAGMIRYGTGGRLQYHNQNDWVTLADATGVSAADATKDAWVDDNTNAMVKLGTQSNGSTVRTEGTEVVIKDNGYMGIGTTSPKNRLHVNGPLQITNELNVGGASDATGSAGTVGQVLTSGGSGAAPTWKNPSVTAIKKITANYTVAATDYTILANATNSGFTITLPTAAASTGRILVIRKTDEDTSKTITFSQNIKASETTSFSTLNINATVRIQSDGTDWYLID